MHLAAAVYQLCTSLPRAEQFGIVSQLQRAAVSILSNIAEGYGRSGVAEFRRFVTIARGSAVELETQLLLIATLYPGVQQQRELQEVVEIQKMLSVLARRATRTNS